MIPPRKSRQQNLETIISEALKDPNLVNALETFEIGRKEYARAVSSYVSVYFSTGNTSNPIIAKEQDYADMDRNKK